MRFPTAYYLMLLYLTVVFKPAIPIISDALSHTFADAIHIATVHAKYGNNHLETELATEGSDNDNSKNQNTVKSEEQIPVHVPEDECTFDFSLNSFNKSYPVFKNYTLSAIFIAKQIPPPKFS